MRFLRFVLPALVQSDKITLSVVLIAILSINLSAQTQTKSSIPAPPPSDAQAVALVQTAIAALGGSAAIAQTQNWRIQGTLEGTISSGALSETIVPNSAASPTAPPTQPSQPTTSPTINISTTSFTMPALLGAVLSKESQDTNFTLHYVGPTMLGSEAVTEVIFSRARTAAGRAQVWYFDSKTSLPTQIEFNLPAQLGQMKSPIGTVLVSNYQTIAGILYPTKVVVTKPGQIPEVIMIQSVSPNVISNTASLGVTGGAQ